MICTSQKAVAIKRKSNNFENRGPVPVKCIGFLKKAVSSVFLLHVSKTVEEGRREWGGKEAVAPFLMSAPGNLSECNIFLNIFDVS